MTTRTLFETRASPLLGRRDEPSFDGPITVAQLEVALDQAARLVTIYGEQYLPIFVRVESELEARRRTDNVIERARAIAAKAQAPITASG